MKNLFPNDHPYDPYEDFPFRYTKQGQAELREKIKSGEHFEQNNPVEMLEQPKEEPKKEKNTNMLQSLLPLLTTLNNPNTNLNDILKLMGPYLNQSGVPVTDMIKLMNQINQNKNVVTENKNTATPTSSVCNIDRYEKVQ